MAAERERGDAPIVHSAALAINSIASSAADVIEALEHRHTAALEGPAQWRKAMECVFERVRALSAAHESGCEALSTAAALIDADSRPERAAEGSGAEHEGERSELHLERERLRAVRRAFSQTCAF